MRSATTIVAPALISHRLTPLNRTLLAILVLRPLVLSSIRSQTTNNRSENDIAVLVLLAKLPSRQTANNGSSETGA